MLSAVVDGDSHMESKPPVRPIEDKSKWAWGTVGTGKVNSLAWQALPTIHIPKQGFKSPNFDGLSFDRSKKGRLQRESTLTEKANKILKVKSKGVGAGFG